MERILTIKKANRLTKPAIIGVAETLLEFTKARAVGKEVLIPRTSLAIRASILSAFPEETSGQESLLKISRLTPLMIALNERADIGVSAELKVQKGHLTQNQLWGLIMLERKTELMLTKRISEFLENHPQEKNTIEVIIEDFLTLSRLRGGFNPTEWPKFLELDSAIFVCAFIHAVNPEILKNTGINIKKPAKNKEELMEKYKIFIADNTDSLTEIQKRLRAIFAAEMSLKVRDDLTDKDGLKIDAILNLPSFARWAEIVKPENPNQLLKETMRKYQDEAKMLFPRIAQLAAEVASHITSVIKARNSQKGLHPIDDPTNFWSCFARKSQTTTLRHELEAKCVLSGLFS